MSGRDEACPVCSSATKPIGDKPAAFSGRTYTLRRCPTCGFAFVANPWTEYDRIYDRDYYAGRGADPHVDYAFEVEHPDETVRGYEWRGIVDAVAALVPLSPETRWLDFGCGHGGLVRYARLHHDLAVEGFDTGAVAGDARRAGIPVLDERGLADARGTFDVVTAIEVIEHVPNPVDLLASIRRLLVPGGLLFLTTGNARPFRRRLLRWRYVEPDVHVSFFEPDTLVRALSRAGFRPERRGRIAGFTDIIRFKVLKSLGVRRKNVWERLVPWTLVAALVDARLGVSAHPVGWAT
jgi:SAM-dependent methyltransferase